MSEAGSELRDFIYLDFERVRSLAAQLDVSGAGAVEGRAERERLFLQTEPALLGRGGTAHVDGSYDFSQWSPERFADGQFVRASGIVRLLDFTWLAQALGGLPAVLRKMSKIEMTALKNSEEGRRMSKTALQQRSIDNQNAISRVEEMKMDELSDLVRQLYTGVVRVKVRPSMDHPQCVLIGSAYADHFYDTPAALSQKYGVEINAGWTVIGQLNMPNLTAAPQPIPVGNQMEDAFEQITLLMNTGFRLANAPAFPAISMTPIAIYRIAGKQ